jgi:hypothetical protein
MNDNRIRSSKTTRTATRDHLRTLTLNPDMKKLSIKDGFNLFYNTPPIYLSSNIYLKGCDGMAEFLRNSRSKLETLQLDYADFDDRGATLFAAGLVRNRTLKNLYISDARGSITDVGWWAIFDAISVSNFKLENLMVKDNGLKDTSADSLSNALQYHNTTLKKLFISEINIGGGTMTSTGWDAIFQFLQSPESALEELEVDGWSEGLSLWPEVEKNDEQITPLTNALVNNCTLRKLYLSNSGGITETGWVTFSNVFRNGNSALESVYMGCNNFTDNAMISFADALANNHILKELDLDLGHFVPDRQITSVGYAAVSHMLCNKSSILSTFRSNNTLEKICHGKIQEAGRYNELAEGLLPEDLRILLQINRNHSNRNAARIKIIMTHFSDSVINVKPFTDMPNKVFPYAIAWMAKDVPGMSVLYQFIRSMPTLSKKVTRRTRTANQILHGNRKKSKGDKNV